MSDLERRRACVRARPRRSNKENGPFSRAAGFSRKLCFFYYHLLRCFFLDVVSYEPVFCFFFFFFLFFLYHILIFHTFSSTRQVVRISVVFLLFTFIYITLSSLWFLACARTRSQPSPLNFCLNFRVEIEFVLFCFFFVFVFISFQ